jgi:hypothetical protein
MTPGLLFSLSLLALAGALGGLEVWMIRRWRR